MAYGNNRSWKSNGPRKQWTPKPVVAFQAPTFQPSSFQSEIVRFVRTATGNLIVDAVAGSGKTSTLQLIVAAILDMGRSYVVVAFNRPIAQALQDRGMNGKTFHSVGYSAVRTLMTQRNGVDLGQNLMDAQKVSKLVADTYPNSDGYAGAVVRLVSLAKNHMLKPDATNDDIGHLISHFDVDWDDENVDDARMADMVRATLQESINARTIDFDDQLYYVWLFGLRVPTFDFVLVDESQDTNPLRRELVKRMMHSSSRLVAVGDPKQAIYGFTGASHDSMDLIAAQFDCVTLPLSVSYRCARLVVEHAQEIVSHILPRDGAPDGSVIQVPSFRRQDFLPTDLLVCRNTAPLVGVAYKLLAARIPCRIMGREIGASLTALIKKVSRKNETLETLQDRLAAYCELEVSRAMKQRKESKAQAIQDKVEAIVSILDSMTPEDADGGVPRLVEIIEAMFSDDKNGCVTLATVHKSKGLEAPRVFILDGHLMPSKMAKQDWQRAQEFNLMYVARTRALTDLVYVDTQTLTD